MAPRVEDLPAPACEGGYPQEQLETFLDEQEYRRLTLWMNGQTMMLCTGQRYDHDKQEYERSCGGVAHGPVIYRWDLERWLRAGNIID